MTLFKSLLIPRFFAKAFNPYWKGPKIRLEVSSKCQLKCPLCITGTGFNRTSSPVGWGNLRFSDFKNLLDQNPEIKIIELSNYGEIFLNPDLLAMMAYAYHKKVKLRAINGVNLNYISDEMAEGLVKYEFEKLKVSIDGASEESYQVYRKGGKLRQVLANIEKINGYKKKYRSKWPKMKWQFIIFGHNEHEIARARQLAQDLKMSFKLKFNYKPKVHPVKNRSYIRSLMPGNTADIKEYESTFNTLYSPACLQLWTEPQVNWDGQLLGCCVNHFGDFGNVFEQGLQNLLQAPKYRYAQKMLLGLEPPREDIPCFQCKRFKKVQEIPFAEILKKKLKEASE